MAKQKKQGSGKGTRKFGRNKLKCSRYQSEGRREKNKARKQRKVQKELAKKQKKTE